jgi:y4mF family transcriptional regulator
MFAIHKKLLFLQKIHNIMDNLEQIRVGKAIRDRRKQLGVNQQTLSELAGVGINTLLAVERGEGNPQLSTLIAILDTLGLQLDIHLKKMNYEAV